MKLKQRIEDRRKAGKVETVDENNRMGDTSSRLFTVNNDNGSKTP